MNRDTDGLRNHGITRRECVSALGAGAGALVFASATVGEAAPPEQATPQSTVSLELRINGKPHNLKIDPRVTLLNLLREQLGLTGTKKGCDHGQCGACTVLAGGRRINSCLSLAASHDGEEITTIEGLAAGGVLSPMQAAFIQFDGFQCGYCTPGQICSAVAMLAEAQRGDASFVTKNLARVIPADLSDDEIRERMSGNICRCGAYLGIVEAIKTAHASNSQATKSKENGQ